MSPRSHFKARAYILLLKWSEWPLLPAASHRLRTPPRAAAVNHLNHWISLSPFPSWENRASFSKVRQEASGRFWSETSSDRLWSGESLQGKDNSVPRKAKEKATGRGAPLTPAALPGSGPSSNPSLPTRSRQSWPGSATEDRTRGGWGRGPDFRVTSLGLSLPTSVTAVYPPSYKLTLGVQRSQKWKRKPFVSS